jgi:hypothetical protein
LNTENLAIEQSFRGTIEKRRMCPNRRRDGDDWAEWNPPILTGVTNVY